MSSLILSLGCRVVTAAFCLLPLPRTHHLGLRGVSGRDSDSLVSSTSSTIPFGFSFQFSQASVIRSYTKFVMGVRRQPPCHFSSS